MSTPNVQTLAPKRGAHSDREHHLHVVNRSNAPKPLGKYSQAIISGNMIYLSGQMGQDPTTGEIVEGGIEAQASQVIRNIEACLQAAGSDLSKIVSRRTYLTDLQTQLGPISAAWGKIISEPYPTATLVQVGALAVKEALVEIEVVAEMPK